MHRHRSPDRSRRLAALLLLLFALAPLAGCASIRDGVARAIGAPTSQEIEAAQEEIDTAESRVAELEAAQEEATREAEAAQAAATSTEDRKAEIRQLYSAMAQQLSQLEGAAADALMETMAGLQRQLSELASQSQAYLDLAAEYEADARRITTETEAARITLADAEAQLAGFRDRTDLAIASTLEGVTLAGDTAASLGVPGAREATEKVSTVLQWGLGTLLTAGTGGGILYGRRKRRQAIAADEQATEAWKKRELLARVVRATETFGLVKDDEQLKKGARDHAGAAALEELATALSEDPSATPPIGAAGAST